MRGRTALHRGTLLFASLALVLGLAEGVARLVWRPPAFSRREPRKPEPGMSRLVTLRDLARPNVRGIYQGVLHETNDRGIRGPRRTAHPGKGVVRIAITGDSVTMGWGVEERDTYVARLERMLQASSRARLDGRRFEVLNLGLAGDNAASAMRRLAKLADYYEADVVIYGFTPNDIEGPNYERTTTSKEQLERFESAYALASSPSYLVRLVGPSFRSLVARLLGEAGSGVREIEHNYFENPRAAADFEAALDVFARLVEARDGCGLVFVHTHLSELGLLYPWRRVNAHVEALARARGLTVVQSYPVFAGLDEPALWVGPTDPHPNAAGHRLLARALRAGLDALPPHCLSIPRAPKP